MIHIISLSDDDCLYAIERKEFSEAILNAGENVAVVMSQDWCPQWLQMKRFLNDEANNQTIEITAFVVEYNKRSFFNKFMKIKEDIWGNDQIPYVRYYKNGKYTGDSNFIWKDLFFNKFII